MNIIPWRRREALAPANLDLEDLWSRFWGNGHDDFTGNLPEVFRGRLMPAVNVAETEESFCITMDCPGLDEDDFQLETMGNQLLISGERKWEEEKKGKEFRCVESQYGKFERTVQLPENARTDSELIEASYNKGVLTVTVPKVQKTPATKIPVRTV